MPRAGEFSLGVTSEDCLEVRLVGLVVRGNYAWCLVIFVIFMRFGGAEVGDVAVVAVQATRKACSFNGERGVGFSLYMILLCWNFVTRYCKRFYRIPHFPIFLLFHLFCIYWDWQGQKCKLECPKVYEINYIATAVSSCTHPCGIYKQFYPQPHKNTFFATENP